MRHWGGDYAAGEENMVPRSECAGSLALDDGGNHMAYHDPINNCRITEIAQPAEGRHMDLTNESYTVIFHIAGRSAIERYFRDPRRRDDPRPWVKVSTRGNEFRATAEQVLNHLLPALAGVQPRITVEIQHHPKY